MNRLKTLVKQLILLGLVTLQALFILGLRYELFKAQVCNKVFQVYLEQRYGVKVDLDLIYKDGLKWLHLQF